LEGPRTDSQFDPIRNHIQTAANQATPYSPHLKEAFAWWTKQFLDGVSSDVALPHDWTSIRTILIFAEAAAGDRPAASDRLYFELPAGIAIESLKTEDRLARQGNQRGRPVRQPKHRLPAHDSQMALHG
jgi:hypothetical protein